MFEKNLLVAGLWSVLALTVVACHDELPDDDHDRLQALLRDAPLTQLPPSVASVAREDGAPAGESPAHGDLILPGTNPLGVWNFEDCNTARTNLADSSQVGNTAFRSVGVACDTGVDNTRGVAIVNREDLVYVPDQPNFTFENGVTVAGWFKPAAVGGTRTLFRKRDKDTSSFALLLDSGKFEFVVNLGNNTAISVISPRRAQAGCSSTSPAPTMEPPRGCTSMASRSASSRSPARSRSDRGRC